MDSVGGVASAVLTAMLGEGGVLVSFGSMTGEPMQLPSGDLIFKQLVVKGFWGIPASKALGEDQRRRLIGELLQRAAGGELRVPVAASYPLAQIADAVRESVAVGRSGKVLLRP